MNNCNCTNNNPEPRCLPNPKPCRIALRTVVLPANLGSNAEGAPYAPALGKYYNTVVLYQANGSVYLYDSNGVYTQIEPDNYAELVAKVGGLEEALAALQEKEQSDVDNLQVNINQLANKEAEDVENLQANINQVATDLQDYQNSPDVRFIEPTYAALEAMDKTGVGDKDYARVLQDETHEGASTYYQFNATSQEWEYVGEVGDYYTKPQIDAKFGQIDTTKLNDLANIKTVGVGLQLTSEGQLSATGGGGQGGATVSVLTTATATSNSDFGDGFGQLIVQDYDNYALVNIALSGAYQLAAGEAPKSTTTLSWNLTPLNLQKYVSGSSRDFVIPVAFMRYLGLQQNSWESNTTPVSCTFRVNWNGTCSIQANFGSFPSTWVGGQLNLALSGALLIQPPA